jgi:alpha-tubulin suppressor-like RCC1 family protein
MKVKILLFTLLLNLQNSHSQCLFKDVTTLNATSFGIGTNNKLYGWGSTIYFNLNTTSNMQTNVTQVGLDADWEKIDGGNLHVLLLKSNGTLWAMGWNADGELGDNSTIDRVSPVQIGIANNWVAISAGQNFSLGLKNDGTLWAWGNNQNGQLGIGSMVNQRVPVQVGNESNWSKIAAAKNNIAFAIKSNGTLWAWGRNDQGYLGLGNYNVTYTPTQIGTDNDWSSVSSGLGHTQALKNNHTLWAWGNQLLGNNSSAGSIVPIQIGVDDDWQFIDANYANSKAVKLDGTLWCWGGNANGQVGDGTLIEKLIPTQVGQDTNWSGIFSGQAHTLAVKTDFQIYSWGTNNFGQLANGNTTNVSSPYEISCFNLSNSDFEDNSVQIVPNPINDTFQIYNEDTIYKVELYDVTGRMIKSWSNEHYLYSLTDINNGVYTLVLFSNKSKIVKKIIKQ